MLVAFGCCCCQHWFSFAIWRAILMSCWGDLDLGSFGRNEQSMTSGTRGHRPPAFSEQGSRHGIGNTRISYTIGAILVAQVFSCLQFDLRPCSYSKNRWRQHLALLLDGIRLPACSLHGSFVSLARCSLSRWLGASWLVGSFDRWLNLP